MELLEAARELRALAKSRLALIPEFKRKRSWRKSELAMSIAGVERQAKACEFAAEILEDRDREYNGPLPSGMK